MTKVLIVGGGVAAHEAAVALRDKDKDCGITVISRESVRPYRRPALSRMVKEDLSDLQLFIQPERFYAERNIELRLETVVRSIERSRREIILASGEALSYDRLLLAVGGRAFLPPLPKVDLPGVCAIREYDDVLKFRLALAGGGKSVVVVGGGLLGLELADSLLALGHHVTVVEGKPMLLPRHLDAGAAKLVEAKLRSVPGLAFLTGVSVRSLLEKAGRVSGVVLTDESELPADLVAFSIGMRPNAELAAAAGLIIADNGGIEVDSQLQTNDPDIFAAGDCVSVEETMNCGLFPAAAAMGKTAGKNLAGGQLEKFEQKNFYAARLQSFGLRLFSIGVLEGEAEPAAAADSPEHYRRLYRQGGRLTGAILLGDLKEALALQSEIDRQLS